MSDTLPPPPPKSLGGMGGMLKASKTISNGPGDEIPSDEIAASEAVAPAPAAPKAASFSAPPPPPRTSADLPNVLSFPSGEATVPDVTKDVVDALHGANKGLASQLEQYAGDGTQPPGTPDTGLGTDLVDEVTGKPFSPPGTDASSPPAGDTPPAQEALTDEQLLQMAMNRVSEELPPLPEGASAAMRSIADPFAAIGAMLGQRQAREQADVARQVNEQMRIAQTMSAHEQAMAQQRGAGGGGRRGFSLPGFGGGGGQSVDLMRQASDAAARLKDPATSMGFRNALQDVAVARKSAIAMQGTREALGQALQNLNSRIASTSEGAAFVENVRKYARDKGMSVGDVHGAIRDEIKRPGSRGDRMLSMLGQEARAISDLPGVAPLMKEADSLVTQSEEHSGRLNRAVRSLRRNGHDVSSLTDLPDLMKGAFESSSVPNVGGRNRLENASESMAEQIRKLTEALQDMIRRVVDKLRGAFGR